MDKKMIGKLLMTGLGTALMFASSFVNEKNQDMKMEETISKKVAEALNQAKES